MRQKSILSPLVFASLLFISGVVLGALGLRVLSPDEKQELISYLRVFMRGLESPGLPSGVILRLSLTQNLKMAALLWALGMAIIGVPLTAVMLLVRGFVFGFSAAFVLKEVPSGGLMLFLAGMLPHNLVSVPALVILASFSISFSLALLKERPWLYGGLLKMGTDYTWKFLLLSLGLFFSSLVEAYVCPYFLSKVQAF